MKFDVSYFVYTTNALVWYTEDKELNFNGAPIEADTESEALIRFKEMVTELMSCNCLDVEDEDNGLSVYEPSDHEFIERYICVSATRVYTLIDECGRSYFSHVPGKLGGHRKLKIYGKLDCSSANRYLKQGKYIENRVFFADEATAKSAGYRPCAICMRKEYLEWKNANN